MSEAVRGNPQIDQEICDDAKALVKQAKAFLLKLGGKNKKNIDMDTVFRVAIATQGVLAIMHEAGAVVEDLRRIRTKQSTAIVGGGRRRA